jgi:NADPH:quinone reductase-like Zn-dependent oxidoreductase
VFVATGEAPGFEFGLEAAGVVLRVGSAVDNFKAGDSVAFIQPGTICTTARIASKFLHKLPHGISYEEAAAIPLAFVVAYHTMIEIAHLNKGESVLIHAAKGGEARNMRSNCYFTNSLIGLGVALIAIAQYLEAEIFVTFDLDEDRNLVTSEFGISSNRVFNSRSPTFPSVVKRLNRDRGVDVVITALSRETIYSALDCVAPFGRFIAVQASGKSDIKSVPIKRFSRNILYSLVDIMVRGVCKDILGGKLISCSISSIMRPTRQQVCLRECLSLFKQVTSS